MADTTHTVEPCVHGTVVALHYDIYSAEPSVVTHNPLPCCTNGMETPTFLTRAVVQDTLREQVLAVLETELAGADAVILTLQHLFPEGPTEQLWDTYPSYLQGGDRVLYDILTGTSPDANPFSERYNVQLVAVTIHCQYDRGLKKDVIVPKLCSFAPYSEPLAVPVKYPETRISSVKLVIASRLADKHLIHINYAHCKVYKVMSLYVSKKL